MLRHGLRLEAILDETFSDGNKLLNSPGKPVRAKVVERHKDKIDFLYTPEGKSIINPENIAAIKIIPGVH